MRFDVYETTCKVDFLPVRLLPKRVSEVSGVVGAFCLNHVFGQYYSCAYNLLFGVRAKVVLSVLGPFPFFASNANRRVDFEEMLDNRFPLVQREAEG